MEYKKVDKCTRREETRQSDNLNLLKEVSRKCNISKTTDLKFQSRQEYSNIKNIESKNEPKIEECIKPNNNELILSNLTPNSEVIKNSNFEYEEEWDIDGIPELLNELDADIEKSLKNIQSSKFDGIQNVSNNKKDIKPKQPNNCKKGKSAIDLNFHEDPNSLKCSKHENIFEKDIFKSLPITPICCAASTFAGFSKGGHLISTSSNSFSLYSTKFNNNNNTGHQFKQTKLLEDKDCGISMSSQAGNNGNTSSNISGAAITNINSSQSTSCSSNSNKLNNKMSIDHQATLDKGLKMKIKRTKPGTKSSEAKHEIVKATEQQQNGLLASGSGVCTLNQEDNTCVIAVSNQSTSSNSQNSNVTSATCNTQGNLNGNKKNGNGNNQNNLSTNNNGSVSLNNQVSVNSNVSQTTAQGTKRGSSGHRRDKAKEKSSHSNRMGNEKNSSAASDKDPIDRVICHCGGSDCNIATCSNACIRKTDNNTPSQRLSTQNTTGNSSTVPPGVFTPSADTSSSTSVSTLLSVSTAISTPVSTQTVSSSVNANAPGPPNKEMSANNVNIKISSHIAAQLAAAAASNNSSNGSCISASTFSNIDMKSSSSNIQSQIAKHVAPGQISATVHHTVSEPISNNKTLSISSSVGTENSKNTSTSLNENTESPPAKRIKHDDIAAPAINKEMVDICIGTSVGTITEPDCLGPCEPGTSVTLEGIVWHETEGGVLVVNVTWRGKTYVGTLLDCTRHDWAPPRFCDSPTEDLDARSSKGRGKRGRASITPDLSNFTETRSSIYFSHSNVHSKLRNGSTKGGRGSSRTTNTASTDKTNSGSSLSSGNSGSTPSTSPTAFLPPRAEKRKSKDESPPPTSGDSDSTITGMANASGIPISSSTVSGLTNQPQSLINPVTGLNVQISSKKCKTSSPCAISPVLLECPEQDCSKKYKHVNGLRYHQSHAHGSANMADEDSMADTEEHATPQPSPLSSTPTPSMTPNPSDITANTQQPLSSQLETTELAVLEESNIKKLDEENLSLQEENSENINSEIETSLPTDGISTSNDINSTITASSGGGGISVDTPHHEQQKQFLDIVGNNKINMNTIISLEQNNHTVQQSVTGKSGVLRFGQGDCKNNGSGLFSNNRCNETLNQEESIESESNPTGSSEKCIPVQQDSNKETCTEKTLQLHINQPNIKTVLASSAIPKPKKGRKSPSPAGYDPVELNTCNISSRDDVQSPAYSDISDDSTPVNDQDHIDKVSKNSEVVKKSQDIGLSSTSCNSNQSSISTTLGNYGVYQFYQQQQFITPPTSDQPTKNTLNTNIGSTIIPSSLTQQQTVSEFNTKKEPPLDLISKANSNQIHSNQHCQEVNKDSTRPVCIATSQSNSELSNVPSVVSSALNSTCPSKSVSHFYAFNYMPSNYPYNVDSNYGSSSITTSEDSKQSKFAGIPSPNDQAQQHTPISYKEDRPKEDIGATDNVKSSNSQISSKQSIKTDSIVKSECIKPETCMSLSQIPQPLQIQSKDHQGIGVYTNMYQRHPLTLASQQLSREEELRRYYIFSDQQRRQNSSSQSAVNQQVQNLPSQSVNPQSKDDTTSSQQQHNTAQNPQQIKIKSNTSVNVCKSANSVNTSKESPKHKQEEELKVIKQEGQKPTMETQGPPPPPTSQYFLHPSYITSTPFGFDPSHPMYRNVLMPASSPYNTPPYHLPIPRYHAPEDLSRNTGTKALDALHHAASQYYTTHKIHELSERALKSPNNSNSGNVSGTIKISGSSPNIGTSQHSNISSNVIGHHSVQNQSTNVTQLPHNLASQTIGISNKQDVTGQKSHGNGPNITGTPLNDPQKTQTGVNSSSGPNCGSGNGSGSNVSSASTSDSRSPPPQRHVHTHHHTHVGLGYPMYPAPYGAAVLASQQAAAVAVINPFPPGPNK
ncbi:probable serine/threonine-protein kinase DDB_G0282963 isoform X2 [Lucilia cuprina]|uniref:probable serine/threonine-protein kinase DDB_G0282963 isoform X2 n=1 Tax=Lucilia cuprina TaxID=7375 RepID=UPI001F059D07|nr:probable serine/threonine-protein kinase DDB_G0282963 isoform X2 [Lucilia cuprina]